MKQNWIFKGLKTDIPMRCAMHKGGGPCIKLSLLKAWFLVRVSVMANRMVHALRRGSFMHGPLQLCGAQRTGISVLSLKIRFAIKIKRMLFSFIPGPTIILYNGKHRYTSMFAHT